MTKFETFYAAALGNSAICTGTATSSELWRWFGTERNDITRAEIAAAQALDYARTAMNYGRISEGRDRHLNN